MNKKALIFDSIKLGLSVLVFVFLALPLIGNEHVTYSFYDMLGDLGLGNHYWHYILLGVGTIVAICAAGLLVVSLVLSVLKDVKVLKCEKSNKVHKLANFVLSCLLLCAPILWTIGLARNFHKTVLFDFVRAAYFFLFIFIVAVFVLTVLQMVKCKKSRKK